jgi:WD40 repeat protein
MQSFSISGKCFECKPLFLESKSIVFFASGSQIHGVSSTTGELIHSFSGHSSAVMSMAAHPNNSDIVSFNFIESDSLFAI